MIQTLPTLWDGKDLKGLMIRDLGQEDNFLTRPRKDNEPN